MDHSTHDAERRAGVYDDTVDDHLEHCHYCDATPCMCDYIVDRHRDCDFDE